MSNRSKTRGLLSLPGMLDEAEQEAVEFLRENEPPEGYQLSFSGGKDSIVMRHLADMAKVKYTAIFNCTTIDPPEIYAFIRRNYPRHGLALSEAQLLQGAGEERPSMAQGAVVLPDTQGVRQSEGQVRDPDRHQGRRVVEAGKASQSRTVEEEEKHHLLLSNPPVEGVADLGTHREVEPAVPQPVRRRLQPRRLQAVSHDVRAGGRGAGASGKGEEEVPALHDAL